MRTIPGMTKNEHGFWVAPFPLRFRNEQECNDYAQGKIKADSLPRPGTKEYDDAPFEQGYMLNPQAFSLFK
jgi:hypothetical protein